MASERIQWRWEEMDRQGMESVQPWVESKENTASSQRLLSEKVILRLR